MAMTDDEEAAYRALVADRRIVALSLADRLYPGMRVRLRECPFVNDAGTGTVMVPEGHVLTFLGVEDEDGASGGQDNEKRWWVFSTEGIPGLRRCRLRLDALREIVRWEVVDPV